MGREEWLAVNAARARRALANPEVRAALLGLVIATIQRPDTTVNESGLNTNSPIGNGAGATTTMEQSAEGCTTKTNRRVRRFRLTP